MNAVPFSSRLAQLSWVLRGKVGVDPTAASETAELRGGIDKYDIVLMLAGKLGLTAYLELCSTTTGNHYQRVRNAGTLETRRLMYRCARFQSDGLPIDYRSSTDDIAAPLGELRADGYAFDICLIDPWHEYAPSYRDVAEAFALLPEGGVLVVHDCLPPSADMATPRQNAGCWCGWTYKAFIDFVWSTEGLVFFTVDTDYGCGVVVKGGEDCLPAEMHAGLARTEISASILAGWKALADDPGELFEYLCQHRHELLNLVSAEEFCATFG